MTMSVPGGACDKGYLEIRRKMREREEALMDMIAHEVSFHVSENSLHYTTATKEGW